MKTRIIEASSTGGNWGKFLVGRFEEEWRARSNISHMPPAGSGSGWIGACRVDGRCELR